MAARALKRPKLFWSDPAPHRGNCNCNYCHHVRNCIVREGYDMHKDGEPNCRRLGLVITEGDGNFLLKR